MREKNVDHNKVKNRSVYQKSLIFSTDENITGNSIVQLKLTFCGTKILVSDFSQFTTGQCGMW